MQRFAAACEAIARTTRKTEKVRILAEYLASLPRAEARTAAVLLSGRPFPAWEETTLNVGGTLLWRAIAEISGKSDVAITAAYRRHGDLGSAACDVLRSAAPEQGSLSLNEVEHRLRAIAAASGATAKLSLVRDLLERATALEAKYLVKIINGEMRIGLRESLVEEAIAKAYGAALLPVQRANMLLGDIGETLELAASSRLGDARMRLFHPMGFMLASPAESAAEAFESLRQAQVEDKYDGIRAQAHCGGASGGGVRLFSRTLDDVTGSFPELVPALSSFRDDIVLDGEIVAWRQNGAQGRALPFAELQKRLGRKTVTAAMMRAVPVAYVVFDVLYAGSELVIDRPLAERGALLDRIFTETPRASSLAVENAQGQFAFDPVVDTEYVPHPEIIRAPVLRADSPAQLDRCFERALERGNEGLMVKDLGSAYAPGRRGRAWLKLKRELATLDVVVTAVEYGHGKRARVLSDFTFAVRDGGRLRNVGKAYSGLTDKEIAELTEWFLAHTLEDQGFRRVVEPTVVIEVAFNAIMESDRHDGGYALRFPRILRLRPDKSPDEIDTLDALRNIFLRQQWPKSA